MRAEPHACGALHGVTREWYEIFREHTRIDAFRFNDTPDTHLTTGTALSPAAAAFCLLEAQRTTVFLRGMMQAICDQQRRFPGERIHILYAGWGPYATLVTPLTAIFSAEEIGFHLLDLHAASLAAVQRLYCALELQPYLVAVEQADAAVYTIASTPHIVVSETMQRALQNETQLVIMLNLLPQMDTDALFLPERITVTAAALHQTRAEDGTPILTTKPLAELFTIGQHRHAAPEPLSIAVPPLTEHHHLVLTTEVQVYRDEVLRGNDTSITLPQNLHHVLYGGDHLRFEYRWQPRPGFHCQRNTTSERQSQ